MDNLSENVIISECKKLIIAFKEHLSILNADYLSCHLIGVIKVYTIWHDYPKGPEDSISFCADLDKTAKDYIGIDKETGHYYVRSTSLRDYYLCDLIHSLRIENDNFRGDAEQRIKELEREWKNEILTKYQRNEHIRRLIWDLKPFNPASKFPHLRKNVIEMIKDIIPFPVDIYSFVYGGLSCKCQEDNPAKVIITNCVGLFGNYILYGRDRTILPDQKVIEISSKIFSPGLREHMVVGISKGVFESLQETEVIKLPFSIKNIEWSFWHCKKLKTIEVAKGNKKYCSIDGVLFSKDHKILYAYPNMHGSIYEVPEGVEIIEKFAFKDCENLEMLILPSTIKQIKTNAFYRATKLRRIVCECHQECFVFEGFYGNYGDVSPKWFYIK
jgi:hypothetical protein